MSIAIPDGAALSRHPLWRADIARILSAPLPWEAFEGRTVLVAGANGFLPAAMVETLLTLSDRGAGLKVIALARSRENALRRFAGWLAHPAFSLIVADVSAPVEIDDPIDMIVHAASQASPRYYDVDPVGTALPNILGTQRLLELARRKETRRFLYLSSSEVYGVGDRRDPIAEHDFAALDPATLRACYAESKRMGETLCVSHGAQYGVDCVIARPFHTYGPGMRLDDGRVFADFVRDIVTGRDIVLNSDGGAQRAFCYLADAVEAFFTLLLKGAQGTAYNVGNAQAVMAIRDLATLLVGLRPERGLVARFAPPRDGYLASGVARAEPNTARLEGLGWRPRTGVAEGFRRTIDIYADIYDRRAPGAIA
ncbi:NAD-dependent epimerase/dehydratase family protein [Methylocystis echinoides]|uniref:dTDP-glucose 4,6-dehydratase n=1 Tax=Methylocystis echinoides TaxID=29468 RepID=A0A9W6GQM2_9HYPH|nr:NAD-dependent epimerase/dehydratase family protein [Methylocystis echinoides]GLI91277.1 dTDP-glucose 4,6-dehydratase [Methylocystis echinoides]